MIPTERNGPTGFHAFRVLFLPSHDTHSTFVTWFFFSNSTLHIYFLGFSGGIFFMFSRFKLTFLLNSKS
jgi:hypothetical protein